MILIHIGLPRGSCESWFAPVFPDPSSDAHLLPASPRPVCSCPDPQTSQPLATPCLPLAVRTCTTSLHKETCSCCPSRFPPLQRLKNISGIPALCCNHLPLPPSAIQMPTAAFLNKPPYWQNLVDPIDVPLAQSYNSGIWTSFRTTADCLRVLTVNGSVDSPTIPRRIVTSANRNV